MSASTYCVCSHSYASHTDGHGIGECGAAGCNCPLYRARETAPAQDVAAALVAEIRKRHAPSDYYQCWHCMTGALCDAVRAATAIELLLAENATLLAEASTMRTTNQRLNREKQHMESRLGYADRAWNVVGEAHRRAADQSDQLAKFWHERDRELQTYYAGYWTRSMMEQAFLEHEWMDCSYGEVGDALIHRVRELLAENARLTVKPKPE